MAHVFKAMQTAQSISKAQNEDKSETVTIRPAATSLFCIDSDDRYKDFAQRRSRPTYPFRFTISLLN